MARTQRITRINALLGRPQGASLAQLMEELEVSRATVNRDLQTLRDEMNAPIIWDRFERTYRIEPNGNAGPTCMVPGLWLTPAAGSLCQPYYSHCWAAHLLFQKSSACAFKNTRFIIQRIRAE